MGGCFSLFGPSQLDPYTEEMGWDMGSKGIRLKALIQKIWVTTAVAMILQAKTFLIPTFSLSLSI